MQVIEQEFPVVETVARAVPAMSYRDCKLGGAHDIERAWATGASDPTNGVLGATYAQLIDGLLFDEEMAEASFMADPTPGNYANLVSARSRVDNLKSPCQRKCCGHSGELHEFICLVEDCPCREYAPGDVSLTYHPGAAAAGVASAAA